MKMSLRNLFLQALAVVLCISTFGCTGADDTKITNAPPPPPPTEAEKKLPKSMPKGYGEGSVYQKAMERAATR